MISKLDNMDEVFLIIVIPWHAVFSTSSYDLIAIDCHLLGVSSGVRPCQRHTCRLMLPWYLGGAEWRRGRARERGATYATDTLAVALFPALHARPALCSLNLLLNALSGFPEILLAQAHVQGPAGQT